MFRSDAMPPSIREAVPDLILPDFASVAAGLVGTGAGGERIEAEVAALVAHQARYCEMVQPN